MNSQLEVNHSKSKRLTEGFFVLIILLTLSAIPSLLFSYRIDSGKRIINVVGHNSPDWDPGIWLISEGRWDFLDFNKKTNHISVREGEEVTLYLTSMDVVHGFHLPDFNVTDMVYPGTVKEIKFVANRTGEFSFSCNIPGRENSCGFGHLKMNGVLSVTR